MASSGGVGGAGFLLGLGSAGVGGAGGGTIALLAGGDLTTGTIEANGGKGSPGNGGGDGGGGAGGAVIVSSASGMLKVGKINVAGAAATGTKAGNGGAGSVGRVRWDATASSAPSSPDRQAHRGPVFALTDRIFTMPSPTLNLLGTADDGFTIRVIDQQHVVHDGGHATFGGDSTAMINPALYPGYNQVCITLDGGVQGRPESDRCVEVAYLPAR